MRKLLAVALGVVALCGWLVAQGILEPHTYMEHGLIDHHAGTATVKADYAQPLQQAITAVREEYGWVVNFEDPPYQGKHDLIDMTNPKYRPTHPNARIVLGPAGGPFQSTYPETPHMWNSPAAEPDVLEKIVSDYNQSGNPGNFVVRELADGSFDVVGDSIHNDSGEDVPITPALDTSILIPRAARSGRATIDAVLHTLSAKIGIPAGIGLAPSPLLGQAQFTMGGSSVPARDLIMQVIDGLGRKYVWLFIYEPQPREYLLVLLPVARAEYGAFGQKRLVPVGPLQVPDP
jgi:hypothetical protein